MLKLITKWPLSLAVFALIVVAGLGVFSYWKTHYIYDPNSPNPPVSGLCVGVNSLNGSGCYTGCWGRKIFKWCSVPRDSGLETSGIIEQ
ncbi:MAG TPA: hypothetical protein VFJ84_02065 [Candidatus Saccharimonadales bacterium]|nr:hypothetical protein [Candidatus Saccharimonadales bacterium]